MQHLPEMVLIEESIIIVSSTLVHLSAGYDFANCKLQNNTIRRRTIN
jgi:hypothetical protein